MKQTKTLSIHPSNWVSNEPVEVVINETDSTFEFNGYYFKLSVEAEEDGFTYARLTSPDWESPLMSGLKMDDGDWIFMSTGISRESKCPYTAAVQVLCNIL